MTARRSVPAAEVPRSRAVLTVAVSTVAFAAALALREYIDPWQSTALAAVLGIALSVWTLGPRLRALVAFSWRGAATAAALGVGLVAATHAGFALLGYLFPDLARSVRGLYGSIDNDVNRAAIAALTAVIVVGEELVWRGVAVAIARARPRAVVIAVSVALYVLPQLPGHVPVLICAAAALGTILVVQRLVSGRLTDVVITHAIWSIAIFVLLPVS